MCFSNNTCMDLCEKKKGLSKERKKKWNKMLTKYLLLSVLLLLLLSLLILIDFEEDISIQIYR